MKILFNSRQFHKALAPWVFLPLFISSITGLLYRFSKDLLGFSREQVHWLMSLHEGEWLGDNGELIYVILNSLGVLWMLITGSVSYTHLRAIRPHGETLTNELVL